MYMYKEEGEEFFSQNFREFYNKNYRALNVTFTKSPGAL